MFDGLRPIILRGDYFVLWRGGRGFRDNDAMHVSNTLFVLETEMESVGSGA